MPDELRGYYAEVTPTPTEEAGYWRAGTTVQETFPHDAAVARAVAAGRDESTFSRIEDFLRVQPGDFIQQYGPASDTTGDQQRYVVRSTYRLSGRDDFAAWLHLYRLEWARKRHERAQHLAPKENAS
ncbi:hypothetical protein AAIB33_06470 [Microbacterium sp. AZCO]|uniref:hypothetical protein n=1 Tax=Microbacterium sp. AZCO TaxID=3142976 RepID=UPI0031F4119B